MVVQVARGRGEFQPLGQVVLVLHPDVIGVVQSAAATRGNGAAQRRLQPAELPFVRGFQYRTPAVRGVLENGRLSALDIRMLIGQPESTVEYLRPIRFNVCGNAIRRRIRIIVGGAVLGPKTAN